MYTLCLNALLEQFLSEVFISMGFISAAIVIAVIPVFGINVVFIIHKQANAFTAITTA